MVKKSSLAVVLLLLACFLLPNKLSSYAQGMEAKYYPQTGHVVQGDFLVKYLSCPDPEKIYGYPITDEFVNQTTGLLVQYFQRAHFELHPEMPQEARVTLTRLGDILYNPGQSLSISPNYPACKTFPETNHQVCYAFLDFFQANGGIPQFGYPISETEMQDGRIVQYFQRALFEWHPELPSGQRVGLADLGKRYFDARNEDPSRLLPDRDLNYPRLILNLQTRAFFSRSVISLNNPQTIYVLVQDQNFLPVANAKVAITVHYPSGNQYSFPSSTTDKNGMFIGQFPLQESSYGVAEVQVLVSYDEIKQETRSSFRIWW